MTEHENERSRSMKGAITLCAVLLVTGAAPAQAIQSITPDDGRSLFPAALTEEGRTPTPADDESPRSYSIQDSETGGMPAFLSRTTTFGLKVGIILPGCVYVAESDCIDSDLSYSLGGFLDYQLSPKLLGGIELDLSGFSAADESETLIDISVVLKAQIAKETSRLAFRPGFGIGYGTLSVGGETTQNLTVRGFLEVALPTSGRISWLGEAAVYGSPAGGTGDVSTAFGPGLLLRVGAIF